LPEPPVKGILKRLSEQIGRQKFFLSLEDMLSPPRIADAADPNAIKKAAAIIRKGGLVAFPTETVYGLGADATNPMAVARIFEVKGRPRMDPLIIHVADSESAGQYGDFPESAEQLMRKFWPGPLTLVVNKTSRVPFIVTAGLNSAAIRVPEHPAALALIRAAGCGIAAPSANPFGYVSPTEAAHVSEQLGDSIDLILDGGPCRVGVESTILSLTETTPILLRAGGIPLEALVSLIGMVEVQIGTSQHPMAPGQLKRHYSTRTPLEISDEATQLRSSEEKVGLLSLYSPKEPHHYFAVEILSPTGNLSEAATNLFRALRKLDSLSLDRIIARPVPEAGLGLAIMDRLRRCSARD
jgi:L-threonylcarbamoyladenylate synthase